MDVAAMMRERRVPLEEKRERAIRLARPEHYEEFARELLGVRLNPNQLHWHMLLVEHDKLLIEAQVGSGKSLWLYPEIVQYICRERVAGRAPRVLFATSSSRLARDYGIRIQKALQLPKVVELYGEFYDVKDTWTALEFRIKGTPAAIKEPAWRASGVGGGIEGTRAGWGILDDFIDLDNALSEADRERTLFWLKSTFLERLDADAKITCIGSSWHPSDAYSHIREQMEGWACYKFPCYGEYEWGNVLASKLWSEEKLEEKRLELGQTYFELRYMMNHAAMGGRLFQLDWLEYVDVLPPQLEKIGAWDFAITSQELADKRRTDPDYTAGVCLAHESDKPGILYLIDIFRKRIGDSHEDYIRQFWEKHNQRTVVVEDNAFQKLIKQRVKEQTLVPVVGVSHYAIDKVTRILNLQSWFKGGKLKIYSGIPRQELMAFISEYTQFPRGDHDDILDALELGVAHIGKGSGIILLEGMGWLDDQRPNAFGPMGSMMGLGQIPWRRFHNGDWE